VGDRSIFIINAYQYKQESRVSELPVFTRKADSEIAELNEHIVELEKENLILKAHYCLDALSVNINKLMLDKLQAKRDLEQQAKGIERVLCESSMSLVKRERMILKRIADHLREQAKGGTK
jgi:hypothetical protein